jgi:two-component system nitrate/nitrite sensor histidine kinase NarX
MSDNTPLPNRLIITVGAIMLVIIVSMVATIGVSRSIESSATAINIASSLRMGADELFATARLRPGQPLANFREQVNAYENRLNSLSINGMIPTSAEHQIAQQYRNIKSLWQNELRPALMARANTGVDPLADSQMIDAQNYAERLIDLVSMLENRTEARIDLLQLIQIISLGLSVAIIVGLFLKFKGANELERSHAALELLHSASRSLFANHDLCTGAIPMLQDLEQLLGIGPIRLFLHDRNSAEQVEAITTSTKDRPFYCKDHHCNACLVTPEVFDDLPSEDNDGRRLLLPIRTPGQLLGTLEVWYPASKGLPETSRRLLETLSDQLATAIFLERQITEEQQLTLAEERTVIARELHDSLAQSLSYLKMQVARLRRLNITGDHEKLHTDILEELSTGLNSAYRQLRELLTTFRLKLDTPDLPTALERTVEEFSGRLGNRVQLEFRLPPQTLSPNEEIHALQIVREGLANAVKHSEAGEIQVQVLFDSPRVKIRIMDNGKGMPDNDQPEQHYGLIIMQDRARTLGGRISIRNRDSGGVEVALSFVPKSRHLIASQSSTNTASL